MNDIVTSLQAELRSCRGSLPSIAESSGISYSWLCKFQAGKLHNPTARTIDRLQKALAQHKAAA
jgi:transcriptional regulator with XRE-family HTH domain